MERDQLPILLQSKMVQIWTKLFLTQEDTKGEACDGKQKIFNCLLIKPRALPERPYEVLPFRRDRMW